MDFKKIIIISPVSRIKNLKIIKKSINFNLIFRWLIIYDGTKIEKNYKHFKNKDQIEELTYISKSNEVLGNGQRNFGLEYVEKNFSSHQPFIYFLDDDNIVHPNFYNLLKQLEKNKVYTFDQQRTRYILSGIRPELYYIDLAMFLGDFNIIKKVRFKSETYNADGSYIEECCKINKGNLVYIDEIASYYNYLKRNIIRRIYYRVFWYLKIFFLNFLKKEIKKQYKP